MAGNKVSILCYGSDLIKKVREVRMKKPYSIDLLMGSPISSLLTSPLKVDDSNLSECGFSPDTKTQAFIELNKKTLDIIEESEDEFLLIDILSELNDRYVLTSGSVKAEVTCFDNKVFENTITKLYPDWKIGRRDMLTISDEEIKMMYEGICTYFKKHFDQKKIIVVECYLAEKYIHKDGYLVPFPEDKRVRQINRFLGICYKAIKTTLPQCKYISFPSWTYSTINDKGEYDCLHFENSYYRYVSDSIEIAVSEPAGISLGERFDEQNTDNRTKARGYVVFDKIWRLEKRIAELENIIKNQKSNS